MTAELLQFHCAQMQITGVRNACHTSTFIYCLTGLPQNLCEWQFANPQSATARKGFQPGESRSTTVMNIYTMIPLKIGYYGRVPKNKWFQTTITNVDPTAKQCRVLHPYVSTVIYIAMSSLIFVDLTVSSHRDSPRTCSFPGVSGPLRFLCNWQSRRHCK